VSTPDLSQDILIENTTNMNRALNGDIVCLEILPPSSWSLIFKLSEPTNLLDKEEFILKSEENLEIEEEKDQNIISLVNNEKKRRVTGKVTGIIKRMVKTYGGSLLPFEDMLDKTKEKM